MDPAASVTTAALTDHASDAHLLAACVRHAIESLGIHLEAARMAVDAVQHLPMQLAGQQPSASHTLDRWHAANLLLGQAFEQLRIEGEHTISAVRELLQQR